MQEQILHALRGNAAADALALAQQWVAHSPRDPQAQRWLGVALQQQGDSVAALAALDAALALAPEDADLHLLRAGVLIAGRDLEGAQGALSRSTTLNPNQFGAYVLLAHLAIAEGNLEEAERLTRLARRIAPEDPQLVALEGIVALRRGEGPRALALLSQAAEQLPDDPRVLFSLGFAYLHNGHLAFAERALQRAIALNPPGTALRAIVAQLVQRQGRPDEALQALREVLAQADGNTPPMQRLAGEVALQAGQPDQALPLFKQALAAWPGDRRTLQGLLQAWRRLGQADDARQTLDEALAAAPGHAELWMARLSLEPVAGDAALALVQRWSQGMPDHLPALEVLMRIHDLRGEDDAAEAVARRVVALEPGRLSGEQRIVEALLRRDPAAAVARVETLLASMPAGPRGASWLWQGRVQDRAGQQAAALRSWLAFHAELAEQQLPLPPQSAPAARDWPALAEVATDNQARPLLLWGAPGAQVERVAAVMGAASRVLRNDRFGAQPPRDGFQNYLTLERLASGELAPAHLVDEWKQQLPARGVGDGNVIDWLLWWDNALLQALRPHLPEGRLAIVLRDPRDMLLDWLAAGSPAPVALGSPERAAQWLAAMLEQVAELHEKDLYPHVLLRVDAVEADPQGLAALLGEAFGQPFPVLPSLGPVRLPPGRWRAWREVLAGPLQALAPVALRLGYPGD